MRMDEHKRKHTKLRQAHAHTPTWSWVLVPLLLVPSTTHAWPAKRELQSSQLRGFTRAEYVAT
jgi:hypothetical protein